MKSSELLDRASPSIQYRLRREVLGQPNSQFELREIQCRILEDESVEEVFSWQALNGWLARDFHGYHSTESGIRFLCEKGVDSDHPTLVNALLSLEKETEKGLVSRPAFPLLIYNYFQGLPSIIC